ncbi:cytochrome c biogenesis protein CcsA [Gilvibacter sediminis]|uniref:cytochrome c biogenesis protein CcsA n=1 Tax=Gilvibacter sediminis TaxID=379071 RepID=UPI0023509546|nr:cytochrome c biogenesis protein CcsA [Gilvibacter sediminis]MDC7998193.1 cytochrome c biogenesis protein CcsA [Gilvibacter sediminis]
MQNKLLSILFSTRLTAVLFIVFAAAMAVGTFLDASQTTSPTPFTNHYIYKAWWFEAIMALFMINFIGNIKRYRLDKRENWATLLLHLSFILILFGAFVTRYIGYEGVMRIREGETENTMLSAEVYLKVFIDGDSIVDGMKQRRNLQPRQVNFSERLVDKYKGDEILSTDYNGQEVSFKFLDYISGAKEDLIPGDEGAQYLKLVEANDGNRHEHWLADGTVTQVHSLAFAFNKPTTGAINIFYSEDKGFEISTPLEGTYLRMADQQQGAVVADSVQQLQLRSLYQIAGNQFVFPEGLTQGKYGIVKAPKEEQSQVDALFLEVTSGGETKPLTLIGGKGNVPDVELTNVGGLEIYSSYGAKELELPFSLTLNDFIADKYPGTESAYSAFKSKLTVNPESGDSFDYDIYMNHVLDQGGYRFFQASFDADEKGTILSVNHDFWGTWITYIGYFLLYLGLMLILFDRRTRFGKLKQMLEKVKTKKAALMIAALIGTAGFAQDSHNSGLSTEDINAQIVEMAVDKEHAGKFGRLIIQDNGRMKPINTFSSELLRKISRSDSYAGLTADQVFLSMSQHPQLWIDVPIIYLPRGNDSIRKIIGVPKDVKAISLLDIVDEQGNNKLDPYLTEATRKNNPNKFEKDFIKVYEHVYLLNQALTGSILKIFPVPGDLNNTWESTLAIRTRMKTKDDSIKGQLLPVYLQTLRDARSDGNYENADKLLEAITVYQKNNGSEVYPSDQKIDAEIAYNRADIFNRLYKYFAMIGLIMFIMIIWQIFNEKKFLKGAINVCRVIIWVFFALMTLGLAARWYISGHAPWSDAYESVIYVAWATVFFGLAFGRKSVLTVASTAFVASIILWVAHENWLDPSIANLQPVLDSYWLMIHVAVIVASYGPFTLGMILGIAALLLMLLTTKKNKERMKLNIEEITIINELALTVGLVMLTIGNFLGGQWANESWGRYWGWDPKETWALISIMIYAFVIHMRLVPGLRGRWTFNFAAVIAYASIMMTYFGVNFYLTGLHSYASGDKPITPGFVYYTLGFVAILSTLAWIQYKKHYKKAKA